MGRCFLHGAGGSWLNYWVQGYASEKIMNTFVPNGFPHENTIGVVTDVEITSHVFDSMEPSPVEGMVWLSVAEESGISFNAVVGNLLTVRLKDCKQYVSGVWIDRVAKIFIDGGWRSLTRLLWDYGTESVPWTGKEISLYDSIAVRSPVIMDTYTDGSQKIGQESAYGGIWVTKNPVPLKFYNTLCFEGLIHTNDTDESDACALYVWRKLPETVYTENAVACSRGSLSEITTRRIDVSKLDGEYYIGFGIYSSTSYVLMKSLWLEAATIKEAAE